VLFPGFVATNLANHGYGADGKPAGRARRDNKGSMPVEDCARQIIDALRGRKRELVMTAQGKIVPWVKLFAPRMVDDIARAALKNRH